MDLRYLQDTDIELLLRLWNRAAQYDPLTPELLEEKVFDDADFNRELALVIENEQQLAGFIMGVVRNNGAEKHGYIKLLAIEPGVQRRGLGLRLLKQMEERLSRAGCASIRLFESSPNYLVPGLDPRYTEAVAFFEKRGYERFGETANMEVDLSNQDFETAVDELRLRKEGVEIRRAIMGDHDEVINFLQRHWPEWIAEVERELLNYPVSLHLGLYKERIIAFAGYDGNNFNTGWFGPMGTDPAARRRGVGGVLLRRCLKDIQAQGHRRAIIPWVGPHVFYSHYSSARISRIFWRYKKEMGKK
jgi:ribosomal protein S18 acetylase RimI-like enzyme